MITEAYWDNPKGKSFYYVKYLPKDYDPAKKYPLVFFLHGAGERGNDTPEHIDLVYRYFWLNRAKDGEDFPFIMAAPQCPNTNYWGAYIESLNGFLDFLISDNSVDTSRIYLTGLSMGGTGTWLWSLANPERFAAIAPVCGTGVAWYGERLVNKPVWAFHGDIDTVVPTACSLEMVTGINKHGGNAKLTLLPGVGHNAWDAAYEGNMLMDWMLQFTL